MISNAALAAIAERLDLWIEHRDIDSLRDGDLRDLLAELRAMRRQHRHNVALLTACRERAAQLDTDYRELLMRQPPEPDHNGDRAAAEAHAAAEIGNAP